VLFNGSFVNFDSINRTFTGIADAITKEMRQNGDDGYNAPMLGVAFTESTCIRAHWAWMVLPAGLVASTMLFFVFMIAQAEDCPDASVAKAWKSSLLPLIFHDLDLDGGEERGQGRDKYQPGEVTIAQMESLSDHLRVRLPLGEGAARKRANSDSRG